MRRKMPRPPTLAGQRAANSKELPSTFDCQNSETLNQEQEDDRSSVPNAHTRIVFGDKASFIYIPSCPLCGLEHTHGLFPYPYGNLLQPYDSGDGYRVSHCFAQGLGRVARMVRGEWRTVRRQPPPEYREPKGNSYRLIPGPEPACFTPRGIRSADARGSHGPADGCLYIALDLEIAKSPHP
jgi:hypothetical protein